MFGFLKTAFGFATGSSWIVYAVVFGLGLAAGGGATWRVMQWHVNEVVAERDQFKQAADLAQQDAKRWHAASDVRDQAVAELKGLLATQGAALDAQKQETEEANRRTGELAAEAQRTKDADDRKIEELQNDAQKHPENDRPLGPIGLQYGKLMYAR